MTNEPFVKREILDFYSLLLLYKKVENLKSIEMVDLEKRKREKESFFFNDTATTEIYTLSLHDALPISAGAFLYPIYYVCR